jgi:hypothetical protein
MVLFSIGHLVISQSPTASEALVAFLDSNSPVSPVNRYQMARDLGFWIPIDLLGQVLSNQLKR